MLLFRRFPPRLLRWCHRCPGGLACLLRRIRERTPKRPNRSRSARRVQASLELFTPSDLTHASGARFGEDGYFTGDLSPGQPRFTLQRVAPRAPVLNSSSGEHRDCLGSMRCFGRDFQGMEPLRATRPEIAQGLGHRVNRLAPSGEALKAQRPRLRASHISASNATATASIGSTEGMK